MRTALVYFVVLLCVAVCLAVPEQARASARWIGDFMWWVWKF